MWGPLKALGSFMYKDMVALVFGVPLKVGLMEFGCLEIHDSGH